MVKAKVLVVAPHIDDAQLGAGGTIHRLSEAGHEIWVCALSDTSSVYGADHASQLREENLKALDILGVPRSHCLLAEYPTRNFNSFRQSILDYLIDIREKIQPDLVFSTSILDKHQDHEVVANEVRRAFPRSSIFGFDTYWNMSIQDMTYVVEISKSNLRAKLNCLEQFASQAQRPYLHPGAVSSLAKVRGLPRGFELAEAFSVIQLNSPLEDLGSNNA